MIGLRIAKPLEMDTLTRTVLKQVEREVEEVVRVPIEYTEKRTVQEPVYGTVQTTDGEFVQVIVRYEEREVEELVKDFEFQTVTKIVTEDVPVSETYDNPAQNTLTKYREAVEWCRKNNAYIKDQGQYYEVVPVPEPTAEELLAKAKAERAAAVAAITVEVDGMVFDGDEKAQERMARTVTAATATGASMDDTTTWVLHDNTVAQVSVKQLATALRKAGEAQTALWVVPYTS